MLYKRITLQDVLKPKMSYILMQKRKVSWYMTHGTTYNSTCIGKCGLYLKWGASMHGSWEQHLKSWHWLIQCTWNPPPDPKSCLLSLFKCQTVRNQCSSVLKEAHRGCGSQKEESFFKPSTMHCNINGKKIKMLKKYKQNLEMLRRLCFHRCDMLYL